jgi:hypothetical protein
VAGFTGNLIDKGGAGLTRQQISDALDKLQAEVGISAATADRCRPTSPPSATACRP